MDAEIDREQLLAIIADPDTDEAGVKLAEQKLEALDRHS